MEDFLRSQLTSAETRLGNLFDSYERLKVELSDAKRKMESSTNQKNSFAIQELEISLLDKEKDFNRLKNELSNLETEKQKLEQKLSSALNDLYIAQESLKQSKNQHDILQEKFRAIEDEKNSLVKAVSKERDRSTERLDHLTKDLENQIRESTLKRSEHTEEIQRLHSQITDLNMTSTKLCSEKDAALLRVSDLQISMETLRTRVQADISTIESLQQDNTSLRKDVANQQEELLRLRRQNLSEPAARHELESRLKSLQLEVEKAQSAKGDAQLNAEKSWVEKTALESSIRTLENDFERLLSKFDRSQAELARVREESSELVDVRVQVDHLKGEIGSKNVELKAVRTQLSAVVEQKNELEAENANLRSELQTLYRSNEKEILETDLKHTREELCRAYELMRETRMHSDAVDEELSRLRTALETAKREQESSRRESVLNSKALEQSKQEFKKLTDATAELRSQRRDLANQANESMRTIATLKAMLANSQPINFHAGSEAGSSVSTALVLHNHHNVNSTQNTQHINKNISNNKSQKSLVSSKTNKKRIENSFYSSSDSEYPLGHSKMVRRPLKSKDNEGLNSPNNSADHKKNTAKQPQPINIKKVLPTSPIKQRNLTFSPVNNKNYTAIGNKKSNVATKRAFVFHSSSSSSSSSDENPTTSRSAKNENGTKLKIFHTRKDKLIKNSYDRGDYDNDGDDDDADNDPMLSNQVIEIISSSPKNTRNNDVQLLTTTKIELSPKSTGIQQIRLRQRFVQSENHHQAANENFTPANKDLTNALSLNSKWNSTNQILSNAQQQQHLSPSTADDVATIAGLSEKNPSPSIAHFPDSSRRAIQVKNNAIRKISSPTPYGDDFVFRNQQRNNNHNAIQIGFTPRSAMTSARTVTVTSDVPNFEGRSPLSQKPILHATRHYYLSNDPIHTQNLKSSISPEKHNPTRLHHLEDHHDFLQNNINSNNDASSSTIKIPIPITHDFSPKRSPKSHRATTTTTTNLKSVSNNNDNNISQISKRNPQSLASRLLVCTPNENHMDDNTPLGSVSATEVRSLPIPPVSLPSNNALLMHQVTIPVEFQASVFAPDPLLVENAPTSRPPRPVSPLRADHAVLPRLAQGARLPVDSPPLNFPVSPVGQIARQVNHMNPPHNTVPATSKQPDSTTNQSQSPIAMTCSSSQQPISGVFLSRESSNIPSHLLRYSDAFGSMAVRSITISDPLMLESSVNPQNIPEGRASLDNNNEPRIRNSGEIGVLQPHFSFASKRATTNLMNAPSQHEPNIVSAPGNNGGGLILNRSRLRRSLSSSNSSPVHGGESKANHAALESKVDQGGHQYSMKQQQYSIPLNEEHDVTRIKKINSTTHNQQHAGFVTPPPIILNTNNNKVNVPVCGTPFIRQHESSVSSSHAPSENDSWFCSVRDNHMPNAHILNIQTDSAGGKVEASNNNYTSRSQQETRSHLLSHATFKPAQSFASSRVVPSEPQSPRIHTYNQSQQATAESYSDRFPSLQKLFHGNNI